MSVSSSDPSAAGTTLQFDTVETTGAQEMACANCKLPITSEYHKLNQHLVCSRCRQAIEAKYTKGEGTSAGRFGRALMYGVGGGIAGAVVYALVLKYANIEAGMLAVLVGYLVGRGVRKGSGNRGGWKYQALAMGLTYLAISGAYMPIAIQGMRDDQNERPAAVQTATPGESASPAASVASAEPSSSAAPSGTSASAKTDDKAVDGAALVIGALFMAFALPVLIIFGGSWFSGLMLAFAMYQAWKLNQRIALPFIGPVPVPVRPVPVPAGE